jgi:hypothetical protein
MRPTTSTPVPGANYHAGGHYTLPAGSGGRGQLAMSLSDLDYGYLAVPCNPHSGVLYTTNNNFSWLTLAKFQNEDTLR